MSDVETQEEVQEEQPVTEESAEAESSADPSSEDQQEAQGQPDWDKRLAGLESALSEERKAKQEYQRQLDYLRGAVEQGRAQEPNQPQQQQPAFKVDDDAFWADPAAVVNNAVEAAVSTAVQKVEMQRAERQKRAIVRKAQEFTKKNPDYPEAEQAFLARAQAEPWMLQAAQDSDDPIEHVYKWHQAQKKDNSAESLQKRIAELEAQLSGKEPPAKEPPKTQAGARQAGSTSAGSGDDPWADRPL